MRDAKQTAAQVLRRAEDIRQKRARRKTAVAALSATVACVCVAVLLALSLPAAPLQEQVSSGVSTAAVLFAGGTVGGFVLAGVIGFAAGAAVALLALKMRRKNER